MVTQTVSEEHLIGVIPEVSRRKGLSGKEFFKLLVTDKHLIFTPQASKEAKKPALVSSTAAVSSSKRMAV
jgi:hypothetical protein